MALILRRAIHRPPSSIPSLHHLLKHGGAAAAVDVGGVVGRRNKSTEMVVRSPFEDVEMGPPDPIIGLNDAFKKDDNPLKVNVGVGAYRDNSGLPYVLPCVRAAEEIVSSLHLDNEYAGIAGESEFVERAIEFAYDPQRHRRSPRMG